MPVQVQNVLRPKKHYLPFFGREWYLGTRGNAKSPKKWKMVFSGLDRLLGWSGDSIEKFVPPVKCTYLLMNIIIVGGGISRVLVCASQVRCYKCMLAYRWRIAYYNVHDVIIFFPAFTNWFDKRIRSFISYIS